VDTSIGATCISDTIFIESRTTKFGLSEFLTESSISKKFLTGISWAPKD
jgi:hypothetical protein